MEHLLDPEDLDNLFALLRRASKHWKDIGRHLGFTISELDKITTKTGVSQIDHYFQELLDMWLDRAPPEQQFPFTEDLVRALREVKSHRMAYDLENSKDFMADKRLHAKEALAETGPANKNEETATMETEPLVQIGETVLSVTKRKETEPLPPIIKAEPLPATMETELPKADPLPATMETTVKTVPLLSTLGLKPPLSEDDIKSAAVCSTWYRFIVCFSLFILFLSLLINWVI